MKYNLGWSDLNKKRSIWKTTIKDIVIILVATIIIVVVVAILWEVIDFLQAVHSRIQYIPQYRM